MVGYSVLPRYATITQEHSADYTDAWDFVIWRWFRLNVTVFGKRLLHSLDARVLPVPLARWQERVKSR